MSEDLTILCGKCFTSQRHKAPLHKCDSCGKSFYNACIKLVPVTFDDKPGKACPSCIAKGTHSLRQRSASVQSTGSLLDPCPSVSSVNPQRTSDVMAMQNPPSSEDMFKELLRGFNELKSSVNDRFNYMDVKLLFPVW